jgi:hypothetical protein
MIHSWQDERERLVRQRGAKDPCLSAIAPGEVQSIVRGARRICLCSQLLRLERQTFRLEGQWAEADYVGSHGRSPKDLFLAVIVIGVADETATPIARSPAAPVRISPRSAQTRGTRY